MTFLTAQWRDLVMLNWEVSPGLLSAYVPRGTELDQWNGRTYLTLVGFRFVQARLLKLPMPFHVNFQEVNLRFYVRRTCNGQVRRGVVFIKEIVPRACVALVARRLYKENFFVSPMSHRIETRGKQTSVRYNWVVQGRTNSVAVRGVGAFRELPADSHEEFIAEHYWGYCRQDDRRTIEFEVRHPRWQAAMANDFELHCDTVANYGQELGEVLSLPPVSAFLVNGSRVEVGLGKRLASERTERLPDSRPVEAGPMLHVGAAAQPDTGS